MQKIIPTTLFDFDSYLFAYEDAADRHLGIVRPDTVRLRFIRKWTEHTIANKLLRMIKTDDILQTLDEARRAGCSLGQVEQLRRWLYQVFDQAMIEGLVKTNPCEEVEHHKVECKSPVFFTENQNKRVISAIRQQRYSTAFLIMMMTGLRLELIQGLTLDCLDQQTGQLKVSQRLIHDNGKMKLQYFSDEEDYSILISEELIELLLREKRIQERCRLVNRENWRNPERLLLTNTDGSPIRSDHLRMQYQELRARCGVKDVSMRTIRSNYLVASFREGGDIAMAARQAGFLNVGSIMRYYFEAECVLNKKRAKRLAGEII